MMLPKNKIQIEENIIKLIPNVICNNHGSLDGMIMIFFICCFSEFFQPYCKNMCYISKLHKCVCE